MFVFTLCLPHCVCYQSCCRIKCHFSQMVLNLRGCPSYLFWCCHGKLGLGDNKDDFLFYLSSWCSGALTVPIQRANEHACLTQVVCKPVLLFYQQARWRAGQMAPNDVTSCFNKTLEGRAASLNTNKEYYPAPPSTSSPLPLTLCLSLLSSV